ncbi:MULTISPECIES: S24 family peptidase [Salipiger]|nr:MULTISPECIES: S24/S26 family peptidase [Salipiger]ALF02087.1 Cro/CI family transcriptional regulator [Thiobacimonas phage vB_ThpS-P1]GGA03353.1 hypothetical protein GCM10011326_13410 [Salipiger profundus]
MEFIRCIEQRLEELDLRPSSAEQRFDLPADTIRNVLRSAANKDRKNAGPTLSKVKEICDALGLELYFGPPRSVPEDVTADRERFATVARYAASAAAGGGTINLDAEPVDHLAFSRDWLIKGGIQPEHCILITARGDSMAPAISDGDLVMIDRRKTEIQSGKVYVYNDPTDGTRVKRLEVIPGSAVIVRSDSHDQKSFPPEFHTGDAMNTISQNVLGEVIWSGHTWK